MKIEPADISTIQSDGDRNDVRVSAIPISETVSIESVGQNEAWLQKKIWDNPSCLGLGDLETVVKEHVVSSGGRVDILLKNPEDDSMFEVETTLGDTDPGHIMRTIEYWDLVKRKWPQRRHSAVLVAERITKRFFNVIHILSDAVPLIAIQANIVKSPHGYCLHFTKVLDVYEELDDETSPDSGVYDESYWLKKSKATLDAAKQVFEITKALYLQPDIKFNKYSIAISSNSYNQLEFRPRTASIMVKFRYGSNREAILKVLESNSVSFNEQHHSLVFQMPAHMLLEKEEMFRQIAELNRAWWVASSS